MPVAQYPVAERPRRAVRVPVLAALILGIAGWLVESAPRVAYAAAAWTTTDLNLREGPGTWYGVILVMPAGAYVEVVEDQQDGFYRVRYDGVSGWAYADYLSRGGNDGGGAPSGSGGATVVTDALNLRAGPGTGEAVLAVMPYGSAVTLTGDRANGFVSVVYGGTAGWAYEAYLSTGTSGGNPSPAPQPGPSGSATVAVGALNLRADASTGSAVLAVMPRGAGVSLTGQRSNGFVSVAYGGASGWAYEAYLAIGGSPAPAPDPNPAPEPGPTGSATVATNALNLRAGPSTGDAVLAVMPYGAGVTLGGQRSNGFVSATYQGTAGWAYEAYLTIGGVPAPDPDPAPDPAPAPDPGPAPGSGAAVTTSNMNMRSGAGTGYPVITVVPAGATVALTGIAQNGFYYVQYNGTLGWISSTGLVLGGSPSPDPGSGLRGDANGDGALSRDEIVDVIYAAADRYGQPRQDMLRVAVCESNLNPTAVNPAGSYGLVQVIQSTWASTPYAGDDIFDAWASANAAGWMWSVGRRNEWVCQ